MLLTLFYFTLYCCFINFITEKHMLAVLLRLEFIIIAIFAIAIIKGYFIARLLLVSLGACEGVLGLSLVINLSRTSNKYFMNSYNITLC